ncbi:hypothetical protein PBAL39_16566 [Pedobacter sp. BAL39]|uniref:hypothetical protein n=1 Tax=Pedobacter sp. BAL39 TaxID=391596 RepID=UPI0001559F82|nr:hypothetical protein [Pedobacter sp. BAL39]EDM35113.1 hypothetical protein PBAL39_16566 [Pedobacter sp. BAL39]
MKNNAATWLGAIFTSLSLVYSGCSYFNNDEEDNINAMKYIEAKAVVNQKMPERVTRYGAKQARYNITIIDPDGKGIPRYNCELGGSHALNDTVVVYYDPNEPLTSEVLTKKP